MTLSVLVISALFFIGLSFLCMAFLSHRKHHSLEDLIPIKKDSGLAQIHSSKEFSASTVATTISLATVILAYAELAGYFGLWLLWTVLTTALGIWVVRWLAPYISQKLEVYSNIRPTLHGYLGDVYQSATLRQWAAVCTSIGFMGAVAVELTVGATVLTALVPEISYRLALAAIVLLGLGFTALGGFRVVILTDRLQMVAIWGTILVLFIFIGFEIFHHTGVDGFIQKIPQELYDLSWREGLTAFLIGITIINLFTYLSDMSMWQKIASSHNTRVVKHGLIHSVVLTTLSWTSLALITCCIAVLILPTNDENPLVTFIKSYALDNVWAYIGLFIVVAGLFAAGFSTLSTQLMAAGHTLYADIFQSKQSSTVNNPLIFFKSSMVLLGAFSVLIVEGLASMRFSIADLVFAIYGAQLGLAPVVLYALFTKSPSSANLSNAATWSVVLGFLSGWAMAFYGKVVGDGNLVFLAPIASFGVSSLFFLMGFGFRARQ